MWVLGGALGCTAPPVTPERAVVIDLDTAIVPPRHDDGTGLQAAIDRHPSRDLRVVVDTSWAPVPAPALARILDDPRRGPRIAELTLVFGALDADLQQAIDARCRSRDLVSLSLLDPQDFDRAGLGGCIQEAFAIELRSGALDTETMTQLLATMQGRPRPFALLSLEGPFDADAVARTLRTWPESLLPTRLRLRPAPRARLRNRLARSGVEWVRTWP